MYLWSATDELAVYLRMLRKLYEPVHSVKDEFLSMDLVHAEMAFRKKSGNQTVLSYFQQGQLEKMPQLVDLVELNLYSFFDLYFCPLLFLIVIIVIIFFYTFLKKLKIYKNLRLK